MECLGGEHHFDTMTCLQVSVQTLCCMPYALKKLKKLDGHSLPCSIVVPNCTKLLCSTSTNIPEHLKKSQTCRCFQILKKFWGFKCSKYKYIWAFKKSQQYADVVNWKQFRASTKAQIYFVKRMSHTILLFFATGTTSHKLKWVIGISHKQIDSFTLIDNICSGIYSIFYKHLCLLYNVNIWKHKTYKIINSTSFDNKYIYLSPHI